MSITKSGKILAKGTHKELLKTCQTYKDTFESQTKKGGK